MYNKLKLETKGQFLGNDLSKWWPICNMKCIDIEEFMNFLADDRKMFYSRLKKKQPRLHNSYNIIPVPLKLWNRDWKKIGQNDGDVL